MNWVSVFLDALVILTVGAGVVQAGRLIYQLRDLRASRVDMQGFVRDFNAAVMRAEAGIKSLRSAARESGDDLEKLVGKAIMVRDELNFIVESADSVAERLSVTASGVLHSDKKPQSPVSEAPKPQPQTEKRAANQTPAEVPPPSRAEQELLQALKKLN